jgi:hypothetical protein
VKTILTRGSVLENTSLNIVKANEFQFRIYADEVITDPALIDAIEIRGICRYYDDVGELCYDTECDAALNNLYSVFVHYEAGGVECCGNFTSIDYALDYSHQLSTERGWPVNDFTALQLYENVPGYRDHRIVELSLDTVISKTVSVKYADGHTHCYSQIERSSLTVEP